MRLLSVCQNQHSGSSKRAEGNSSSSTAGLPPHLSTPQVKEEIGAAREVKEVEGRHQMALERIR
jgi:hypothetical protein